MMETTFWLWVWLGVGALLFLGAATRAMKEARRERDMRRLVEDLRRDIARIELSTRRRKKLRRV